MMSTHIHTDALVHSHRGYIGNLFYNVSDHSVAAEEIVLFSLRFTPF